MVKWLGHFRTLSWLVLIHRPSYCWNFGLSIFTINLSFSCFIILETEIFGGPVMKSLFICHLGLGITFSHGHNHLNSLAFGTCWKREFDQSGGFNRTNEQYDLNYYTFLPCTELTCYKLSYLRSFLTIEFIHFKTEFVRGIMRKY